MALFFVALTIRLNKMQIKCFEMHQKAISQQPDDWAEIYLSSILGTVTGATASLNASWVNLKHVGDVVLVALLVVLVDSV